jgi:hypothetical protein
VKLQLEQFSRNALRYDEPRVPDLALGHLLSYVLVMNRTILSNSFRCLEEQAQEIEALLNQGYFRGVVNSRAVAADVIQMICVIDGAFRTFQVSVSIGVFRLNAVRRLRLLWMSGI